MKRWWRIAAAPELTCLLDAISTNQTAFWREPKHFQYLADEVLPVWPPERRHPLRGKLWSAGCSSGEEPYTLAIMVMTAFPGEDLSQVKIYASDLNTQVLTQAERGIYPLSRVEPLPPSGGGIFSKKGFGTGKGSSEFGPRCVNWLIFSASTSWTPYLSGRKWTSFSAPTS
jgi:chemotaxis protein methyltransferase CheR